jgi:hypothetical protein
MKRHMKARAGFGCNQFTSQSVNAFARHAKIAGRGWLQADEALGIFRRSLI